MEGRRVVTYWRTWTGALDKAIARAGMTSIRHRVERVGDEWVVREVGA
jgi:hypothetical protein